MADLSTFTRAKDWAIIALIGFVVTLLGFIASDNRRRIEVIENRIDSRAPILEAHNERITRLEEINASHRAEIGRRLERIEGKLDRLSQ